MKFSEANFNKVQRFRNYIEETQKAQSDRFDAIAAELGLTDEQHILILWDVIFNGFKTLKDLEERINTELESGLKTYGDKS